MNEADGFRIEAALRSGFAMTNDNGDEYACTEAQLIAFAKACERAGRAQIAQAFRAALEKGFALNPREAMEIAAEVADRLNTAHDAVTRRTLQPSTGTESFYEKIARANAWFDSLTPEQQAEHREEQRQSWARGESQLDRKP